MPVGKLEAGAWTHAPRLPLGDPYRGVCRAHPAEVFEPPEPAQRDLCNCGYARGHCDRFPEDGAADAVRFSVTGDRDGRVKLVYIFEKDHAPAGHGALEYEIHDSRLSGVSLGEVLACQARAFIQSYLQLDASRGLAAASGDTTLSGPDKSCQSLFRIS
jgi:hypothetical protein